MTWFINLSIAVQSIQDFLDFPRFDALDFRLVDNISSGSAIISGLCTDTLDDIKNHPHTLMLTMADTGRDDINVKTPGLPISPNTSEILIDNRDPTFRVVNRRLLTQPYPSA
jgi:hypothetical protein